MLSPEFHGRGDLDDDAASCKPGYRSRPAVENSCRAEILPQFISVSIFLIYEQQLFTSADILAFDVFR